MIVWKPGYYRDSLITALATAPPRVLKEFLRIEKQVDIYLRTETAILESKSAPPTLLDIPRSWSTMLMTSDCSDGYCKQKVQAIDNAIGHTKNEWATLLYDTSKYEDVFRALKFCEAFRLEARVSVTSEGYRVQFRQDTTRNNKL